MLIDALHGRPAAERLRGLRRAGRVFDGLRLVPLGRTEGERAGEWRRAFAARGVTLAQADCLIAAAALSVGASLASGNPKDFPVPELRVEHWPVGA